MNQMQNAKYCEQKGHEMNKVILICTHHECKQEYKWACDECTIQQTHLHGQLNSNQLLNQQQFLDFMQSKVMHEQNATNKHLIQILIKQLQQIISSQGLFKQLEEDLMRLNAIQEEIEQIIIIATNDFYQLQNQQINKIVNIGQKERNQDYNLSQDQLKALIQKNEEILNTLKLHKQLDVIDQKIDTNIIKQDPLQLEYEAHIKFLSEPFIYTSQISSNEKYLVIGGNNKRIQVFDLITKQVIKCIDIKRRINILKFTDDSKFLYCGDIGGYVLSFEVNNNFKQILKTKIHTYLIQDIITIDNNQIITCSDDKSIIITNCKLNKRLLLIRKAHSSNIRSLDYDRQNNMIISCSDDKSIKFFSKTNGKLQIEQKQAHDNLILYLQLNNDKLISCSYQNIIFWKIDYHQKQIIQIKLLDNLNFNFSTVSNGVKMVLVGENIVQILDDNLNPIKQIKHKVKEFLYIYYNYIRLFQNEITQFNEFHHSTREKQFTYSQKGIQRVKIEEKKRNLLG